MSVDTSVAKELRSLIEQALISDNSVAGLVRFDMDKVVRTIVSYLLRDESMQRLTALCSAPVSLGKRYIVWAFLFAQDCVDERRTDDLVEAIEDFYSMVRARRYDSFRVVLYDAENALAKFEWTQGHPSEIEITPSMLALLHENGVGEDVYAPH